LCFFVPAFFRRTTTTGILCAETLCIVPKAVVKGCFLFLIP
jgi:hypothetical protein